MISIMKHTETLWLLYVKEAGLYFNTPVAYIITTVFLLITGYFFSQPLFLVNQANINSFVGMAPLLLTFFVPAITMKLFAEETKTGTIEIMFSLPVADWQILGAKFLAAMTVISMLLACTFLYPVSVGVLGRLDWGAAIGAYAGLWLTCLVLTSAGIFSSALTRNQVVAFIIAFLICFSFYMLGKVNVFAPAWLTPFTDFLGMDLHLDRLSRGIFDSRDLVYYITVSGFFLFLTQVRLWMMRSD